AARGTRWPRAGLCVRAWRRGIDQALLRRRALDSRTRTRASRSLSRGRPRVGSNRRRDVAHAGLTRSFGGHPPEETRRETTESANARGSTRLAAVQAELLGQLARPRVGGIEADGRRAVVARTTLIALTPPEEVMGLE